MKIYVVIGSTGEYSDHREWPVCWRKSLDEANELIGKLKSEADSYLEIDKEPYSIDRETRLRLFRDKMLDRSFSCDWSGTDYSVWTIDEHPSGTVRQ